MLIEGNSSWQAWLQDNVALIMIALVAVIAFVVFDMARSNSRIHRRASSTVRYPKFGKRNWSKPRNMASPQVQMTVVEKVGYRKVRLVNNSEQRVLIALEETIREIGQGHRVMAQTSLGEIIEPFLANPDPVLRKEAQACINSKRLDFAVFDQTGEIVLAVEYQGGGHHQSGAFMRDAVKREALRKAGVPFLEVDKTWTPATLRPRVTSLLLDPSPRAVAGLRPVEQTWVT